VEDLRELDREVVLASVGVAKQLDSSVLTRPTPCVGWTVADLLAHMTVQHRGFAAAARGAGAQLSVWQVQPLGDHPAEDYAAAADDVIAAFAEADVVNATFRLPEISRTVDFPAAQAISFHFIDYVAHGWDLAMALGVPWEPGTTVLDAAAVVAARVPTGDARLTPGAAFQPVVAAEDDAGPLDRILAVLGRSPNWPMT
jgi:uncharacterized protein (TIGR03086 family)